MLVTLNTTEIERLIKDNLDTPRGYDIEEVIVFTDMNAPSTESSIKAEITMVKDEV